MRKEVRTPPSQRVTIEEAVRKIDGCRSLSASYRESERDLLARADRERDGSRWSQYITQAREYKLLADAFEDDAEYLEMQLIELGATPVRRH